MKKQLLSFALAALMIGQVAILPLHATALLSAEADSSESAETPPPDDTAEAPVESYTHEISEAGLELIKSFEGFSAYPLWDYQQYSYGYGSYCDSSTVYADPSSPTGYSTTLYPDGIPEREAAILLKDMVDDFNIMLNDFLVKYKIKINQNQFDALASFAYNLGKYIWIKEDHTLRNMLIAGDYTKEELTETFGRYCHAGGVRLEALYQRRMREAAIFFSEYSMSDPDADLYVVNVTGTLTIRSAPSKNGTYLGAVKGSKVIRVHQYSEDGKWGYTSYCGYYGWVSMDYLVGIDEDAMVTKVNANGTDDSGIRYTFDNLTMTATVGGTGSANSSGYDGAYAGEIYLTKYLLYNNAIYILSAVSDTAFTGCQSIKNIFIPSCVTEIGDSAFSGSSLKEIYYTIGSYTHTWAKESEFTATDERCRSGHTSSAWKITTPASSTAAQVEEQLCSVCKETQVRKHSRIEIASYPSKTEYKEGQAFQQTGMTVRVVYSDGSTANVSNFTVSGYNKNELGVQTLTVAYSIFTTTLKVEVSQKSLTKISIAQKPKKLTYVEGQDINLSGLKVTASYDNNTSTTVSEYSVSGYNKNKIGTQTITVTYNNKSATFQVTVRQKSLTNLQIVDYPQTMEYFCGENFDTTGLRLRLSYDNGTTELITKGYTISGYDKTLPGTQTVKVSYGGKSQSMRITVILNYLKSDSLTVSDQYTSLVPADTTVAALREYFASGDRIEVLKNGKALPDTASVATGQVIRLIYNGKVQDTSTLLVGGDLTGDGHCTISDFAMMGDYLMGKLSLSPLATPAGDLDGDGVITLADYCALYELTKTDDPTESV